MKRATSPLQVIAAVSQRPYQPVLTSAERKAYQVAHRIMSSDLERDVLAFACPSTRRVKTIDAIAAIIMEELK